MTNPGRRRSSLRSFEMLCGGFFVRLRSWLSRSPYRDEGRKQREQWGLKMTVMADRECFSWEEMRLAKLLCQGMTREAIARSLDMDPAEVVSRVRQLITRIGAKNRNDLIAELDKLRRLDG